MEKVSFIILICCIFIPLVGINFLWPSDSASREKTRKYLIAKGVAYLILAAVSIVYDFIIHHNYSPSILLTICIAIFESFQILIQEKAMQMQREAEAVEKAYQEQNNSFLKNIELLFCYCSTQLIVMKEAHETIEARQLAYEKVSDYLKYYYCANHFLDLFSKYVDGKGNYDDIDAALCELKVDMEMYVTEIVKTPE